jgi:hypothetical protein
MAKSEGTLVPISLLLPFSVRVAPFFFKSKTLMQQLSCFKTEYSKRDISCRHSSNTFR